MTIIVKIERSRRQTETGTFELNLSDEDEKKWRALTLKERESFAFFTAFGLIKNWKADQRIVAPGAHGWDLKIEFGEAPAREER